MAKNENVIIFFSKMMRKAEAEVVVVVAAKNQNSTRQVVLPVPVVEVEVATAAEAEVAVTRNCLLLVIDSRQAVITILALRSYREMIS